MIGNGSEVIGDLAVDRADPYMRDSHFADEFEVAGLPRAGGNAEPAAGPGVRPNQAHGWATVLGHSDAARRTAH